MGIEGATLNLLHHPTGQMYTRSPDWVVLAVPASPVEWLYQDLKAAGWSVDRVGDCVAPRRAHAAVVEGERAGAATVIAVVPVRDGELPAGGARDGGRVRRPSAAGRVRGRRRGEGAGSAWRRAVQAWDTDGFLPRPLGDGAGPGPGRGAGAHPPGLPGWS